MVRKKKISTSEVIMGYILFYLPALVAIYIHIKMLEIFGLLKYHFGMALVALSAMWLVMFMCYKVKYEEE